MDRTADLCSEDIVDEAVLLDSRQPGEAVRDDLGPKVISAAGQVLHVGLRPWQRGFDPLLELIGGRHPGVENIGRFAD